jgi:hypothetical protein
VKDSDVLLLLPLLLNLCRALSLLVWWTAGMEQRCVLVSHVVPQHCSMLALNTAAMPQTFCMIIKRPCSVQ